MAWHGGSPVEGRPFRSQRTGLAMEHADWADPPTVRLTRASAGRDRAGSLYGTVP
jgi:hypothetical protein